MEKSRRKAYGWLPFAALATAACFYLGYSSGGPSPQPPAPEERNASGFNVDAVAADRAPLPVRAPAPQSFPAPRPLVASPAVAPVPAVGSEPWVRSQSLFVELMAKPVDFIVKKTLLGKAEGFEKFARDPRRVDNYLSHPLIRGVLDNPRLLRGLLSSQAMIDGFLRSPAMQDSRAIAALSDSPLLKRLSQDPGVQAVLKEPGFVNQLFLNPHVMGWLMQHPDAMGAFARMNPTVGQALGPLGAVRR